MAGVQSVSLIENSQSPQVAITDVSQSEPNPATTAVQDTVAKSPSPIENMFHQVVDWLYPTQKEKKK
jgi:hypothetical protein